MWRAAASKQVLFSKAETGERKGKGLFPASAPDGEVE
jgi:hypothetical protein